MVIMALLKSFKTKPRKGLSVEVQILDKGGKPQDFCADHDVFAVEPGPFTVEVVVNGAAGLLAELNGRRAHEKHDILLQMKVDGHDLACQFMHSREESRHKFETQYITGPDGVTRMHALEFDTPVEVRSIPQCKSLLCIRVRLRLNAFLQTKDGRATAGCGATSSSGDTGKMELQFIEVVTLPPGTS